MLDDGEVVDGVAVGVFFTAGGDDRGRGAVALENLVADAKFARAGPARALFEKRVLVGGA